MDVNRDRASKWQVFKSELELTKKALIRANVLNLSTREAEEEVEPEEGGSL